MKSDPKHGGGPNITLNRKRYKRRKCLKGKNIVDTETESENEEYAFWNGKNNSGIKRANTTKGKKMKSESPFRLSMEKHMNKFSNMLTDLYDQELLTDVTLHCSDGSLKAHKLVLASCSPYFRRIFMEHTAPQTVFIMHGISVKVLKRLIELIYHRDVDIPVAEMVTLQEVAMDLQMENIECDELNPPNDNLRNHNIGTRFRGQKRVLVNYAEEDTVDKKISRNERLSVNADKSTAINSDSSSTSNESNIGKIHENSSGTETVSKGTPWALKQRKYKCDICPMSFKRSSHLTRHQLVHTGERPYACDQCDKAFSRPDKLKHHIKKCHVLDSLNSELPEDSPYTIGHVQILSGEPSNDEFSEYSVIRREDLTPTTSQIADSSVIGNTLIEEKQEKIDGDDCPPQKKGRGRPRKYPKLPPPLIKRPRGRPRIRPTVLRGQQCKEEPPTENYDLTNMPFGDLEYLTKPLRDPIQLPGLMEPFVEIKTEVTDKSHHLNQPTQPRFLQNIGLLENNAIGKIGDCTITVGNVGNS